MGFFSKEKCPVCEQEIGMMEKSIWKKDGAYICGSCYTKLAMESKITGTQMRQFSVAELKKIVHQNSVANEKHSQLVQKFQITKVAGKQILIDEQNKLWTVGENIYGIYKTYGTLSKISSLQNKIKIFNFSDIIDFELIEDGHSITKGGVSIGKALIGDFLVGIPGFIVGGVTGKRTTKTTCDNMQIRITLNNLESPMIMVPIITSKTPEGTKAYKNAVMQAQEILSCLNIMSNAKDASDIESNKSSADEIKKYKELLDDGAITQQEYEKKKQQLLDK